MPTPIAEVILDNALEKPLHYLIESHLSLVKVGMRVEVPLRGKKTVGTIIGFKEKSPFKQILPIYRILNQKPLISEELFKLAHWISTYYCAPLHKVIKTLLPPALRKGTQEKTQGFVKPLLPLEHLRKHCIDIRKKHPAQAKVLDLLLLSPKGIFLSELIEKGNISVSPIRSLEKNKVLKIQKVQIDRSPIFEHDFFPTKPKLLNKEQQSILNSILTTCSTFQTHLIYGVTGSGKTEIYLQAIDHVLKLNKSVIYLVPEISLTSQTIERFKGRFGGEKIAILHHRLSHGERFDTWQKIQSGKSKIIIGARSAIFSPTPDLGMIIVDEEHDSSYKQSDESPKYHGRDVAIVRGKFAKCPVILGTATPSLESYHNALKGKYQLHRLQNRADKALLPQVALVDMQKENEKNKAFTLFSDPLIQGIEQRLEKGEQTILFLNRRGYHTSAQCLHCGYKVICPHCELNLTYHLGEKILACHLCDYRLSPPKNCPECHQEGPLKFKGVGTEKVEKALYNLFPTIRTLRLDADTTRHKGSHEKIFKQFRSGKADVLIGTQMVAKGLHFPLVTLVGVIGIDGSLNIPDFRAGENVFQLLTQVSGRSGRGEIHGEVIIQTHLIDNGIIHHAANQDFEGFYKEEIALREQFHFPPFTHLVKCSFSGSDPGICEKRAQEFRKNLITALPKEVEVLPVIPCGYAKIQGKYRFQFLIKIEKITKILTQLQLARAQFGKKKEIRLSIDIDPLTTFF